MNIQTFITIGAIILFGLLGVTLNRTISNAEQTKLYAESIITANSIAQNVINEIKQKKFDKNVGDEITVNLSSLTPASQFGAPQGRPASQFVAVEEYHNHKRTINTRRLGNFNVDVKISYVQENDFRLPSLTQTRTKEILVNVTNKYLIDTLKLRMYKTF
ncbi:MAG: hypothetical protein NZM09_09730 [Ignavibacterium sp.]|nr:hypothetical protein [Ignavibacterium sp.]MCX7611229.1 hypothetical protein [Ignavibacterium sp.]MDW8375957.1 hypothetical protein [Ignavibacteriales bacterium]